MNPFKKSLQLFELDCVATAAEFDKFQHLRKLISEQPDFTTDHVPMEGWPDTVHKMLSSGVADHLCPNINQSWIVDADAFAVGNYAAYFVNTTNDGPLFGEMVWLLKIPDQRIADGVMALTKAAKGESDE